MSETEIYFDVENGRLDFSDGRPSLSDPWEGEVEVTVTIRHRVRVWADSDDAAKLALAQALGEPRTAADLRTSGFFLPQRESCVSMCAPPVVESVAPARIAVWKDDDDQG